MDALVIRRADLESDTEGIIWVYHEAMVTTPWFEDLSRQTIVERLNNDFSQYNSKQMIGELGGVVCSAMWWDETNPNILLPQRGEAVSSYCRSYLSGKLAWFRDLLIAKQFQGQGMGGKMVERAITLWKDEGYDHALLRIHLGGVESTIPSNIKAIKLYDRYGFKPIEGIEQIAYDINENPLRMGYMVLTLKKKGEKCEAETDFV